MRVIYLVALAIGCGGCSAARDLTSGVAVWPFLFGTTVARSNADFAESTTLVVTIVNVVEGLPLDQFPEQNATVFAVLPNGQRWPMPLIQPGVYGLAAPPVVRSPLDLDGVYRVEATVAGHTYWVEGSAIAPLDPEPPVQHRAGKPLTLRLPKAFPKHYDTHLVQVHDDAPAVVYDTLPTDLDGWLTFAARRDTPQTIEIPGEVFDDAPAAYGVSVFAAVRSRESAEFSDNLTSAFFGFTTGTARVMLVRTQ